ncbi:hypothetical protein SAZ11_05620 [Streptomyces sp. FXJ1.4098]|nr:hypothetical protein [Streptomyces sp. FXJ1.4098]
MPASEHQLFVADQFVEERYADCVTRPDIVIGPDGPRFLEFNVSGALGGPVETHCRLEVWRRLYADDAGRVPFGYQDPFAVRAEMFRGLCAELAAAPRVALVGSARDQGVESTRYFDVEADYFNSHGLTARFFEPRICTRHGTVHRGCAIRWGCGTSPSRTGASWASTPRPYRPRWTTAVCWWGPRPPRFCPAS